MSKPATNGKAFEKSRFDLLSLLTVKGQPLVTMKKENLAGCTGKYDIVFSNGSYVELKSPTTTEYGQFSMKVIKNTIQITNPDHKWLHKYIVHALEKYNCEDLGAVLGGKIPESRWKKYKGKLTETKIPIDIRVVRKYYVKKDNDYIIVGDCIFNLMDDPFGLGDLTDFDGESFIRLRIKQHKSSYDQHGKKYVNLSFMGSLCVKNVKVEGAKRIDNPDHFPTNVALKIED